MLKKYREKKRFDEKIIIMKIMLHAKIIRLLKKLYINI